MLDAYIIEKIKREQEGKDSFRRPQLEIPRPSEEHRRKRWDDDERDPQQDRGVVIIEF